MRPVRLLNVDPRGAVARQLLQEAALEVRPLYEPDPAAQAPLNAPLGPREVSVAALRDDAPVAGGALRQIDAATAELSRVFVRRANRRQGLARMLLSHLLREARRLGYLRIRLETGHRQPAAMALYESLGFTQIPPFGSYASDPTSVCYELHLGPARAT